LKLETLRKFAMSLPAVTEEPHHNYSSFRVGGKIFVTVPPEGTHVHVFVSEPERELAVSMYPEFVEKLLWGGKVVGVRVFLAKSEADAVRVLVRSAFELKSGGSKKIARRRG
jgi:hypothetical protein